MKSTPAISKGGSIIDLKLKEKVVSGTFHNLINKKDIDTLKTLLQSDTRFDNMEELDEEGQTCLHSAIRSGDSRIVELFLDYYQKMALNINIQDSYGNIYWPERKIDRDRYDSLTRCYCYYR